MAPKKAIDKGKAPMIEEDDMHRPMTRSRSTGIIIREAVDAPRRLREHPRVTEEESIPDTLAPQGEEVRPEPEAETGVQAEEVPMGVPTSIPGPSDGVAPTTMPESMPSSEERMAAMMDSIVGVMQSFQEFIQSQTQQRAAVSPVPPMRRPSPVHVETPEPEPEPEVEQRRGVQEDRVDMRAFQDMRPPTFQGEMDYRVADRWVTRLEKIFDYLQCTEEQRVRFASFMLEGEAEAWWRTERQILQPGQRLTWAEFLARFYRHYVPDSEKSRRAAEFMTLIQGKLSVAEYDAQFRSLMRFVPWAQADPREAARKFQEGLKVSIRRGVALLKLTDYGDILDIARVLEREEEEYGKIREKRKGVRSEFPGRKQKPRGGQTQAPTGKGVAPTGRGACFQCGQFGHRKSECPQLQPQPQRQAQGQPQGQGQWQRPGGPITCFHCGQVGHRRWECPQLQGAVVPRVQQQPTGRFQQAGRGRGGGRGQFHQGQRPQTEQRQPMPVRVQAITGQEAKEAEGVVTGNLMVCGHLAHVLFDPGATHSFIALSFAERIGLSRSPLHVAMCVSTPLQAVCIASEVCGLCDVMIEGRQFYADLMVLDMRDLDVILGMDWLSKWNAVVQC